MSQPTNTRSTRTIRPTRGRTSRTTASRTTAALASCGALAASFGLGTVAGAAEATPTTIRYEAFHDINGDGQRSYDEPLVAGYGMRFEGISDTNVPSGPEDNTGTNIGTVSQSRFFLSASTAFAVDEGLFAFAQAPEMNSACSPSALTLTLDGEPYDDGGGDDDGAPAPGAINLDDFPQTRDPEFAVDPETGGFDTFAVPDGSELVMSQALDCDDVLASGTAFNDVDGDGEQDENEPGVGGVIHTFDPVTPFPLSDSDMSGDPLTEDEINEGLAGSIMSAETGSDGLTATESLGQLGWEEGTDGEPFTYFHVVELPDGCSLTDQSGVERLGDGSDNDPHPEGFETDNSFVAESGFWTGADYEVGADSGFGVVEVEWGDEINLDLPLDCDEDLPPVTSPSTTQPPTTQAPATTQPTTSAPATTQPSQPAAPGGVTVDTGSARNQGVSMAVGFGGLAVAAGGAAALVARQIRRG